MNLKAALFTKTGPAVAKSVLGILFPEPLTKAAVTTIFDLLLERWKDAQAASKGKLQFDKLAFEVSERLLSIFEQNDIQENERLAVAQAIADRLLAYPFSSKKLAELDNNPENLSRDLLSDFEKVTKDFSEPATELYRRSIKLATQYIINIADILPSFSVENFREVLERLSSLEKDIKKILDNVKHIHQTTPDEFEADFRGAIARQYDFMELFGTELDPASQRHQLTVAYISLNTLELIENNEDLASESIPLRMEKAIAPHKNILIIGPAGSGKTTIVKWLGVNIAQRIVNGSLSQWGDLVPFIITLRTIKGDEAFPMPENWIHLTTPALAVGEPQGWVYKVLKSGKGLILIDGIDEVPQKQRADVRDWISNLKETFQKNHFILTSRPAAVQDTPDKKELQVWQDWIEKEAFHTFELQDLQDDHLNHFIEHWHQAVEKATPESRKKEIDFAKYQANLIRALGNTPPLKRLAVTPLLCAMICAIHYCRQMNLPGDRLDLYEECVKMLLERDPLRGVKLEEYPKFSYRQKKNLMSHLAYSMMRRGLSAIEYDEMKKLIANRLELIPEEVGPADPDKTCEYFIARTGLLRQIAPGEIDFTHRTFEEYLAAYAAVGAGELDELLKHVGDDQWNETIIVATGLAQDRSGIFIKRILSKNNPTATILALACMETASNVPKALQAAVRKKVSTLVPPMRKQIKLAIAATGNLAIPALKYKKNWKANQAAACAETLGLIGTELAMKSLIPYLFDSRVTVARIPIKYFDEKYMSAFVEFILNLKSPVEIAEAKEIGYFILFLLLISGFSKEKILKLLKKMPSIFPSVLDIFDLSKSDLPQVITMLKESAWSVRRAAAEALGKIGSHDDLPQVIAMLKDSNWSVRKAAVEALGKLSRHDDLPQATTMLKDPYGDVSQAAVEAFGKVVTHDDLPQVISMLKDPYADVRQAAVAALGKLGSHDDLPQVITMLKHPHWRVRLVAVEALGKLGTHEDLLQVITMLKDSAWSVSQAAVAALGKLGGHDDLPQVITLLKDSDWSVRRTAVAALGKLGSHDDLPQVITMLKDSHWRVRETAVAALGKLGTHDDLPQVITMLKDSAWRVSHAAVAALGKLGSHDDLPQVFTMLKDSNWSVRKAAVEALGKLGTHDDLPQVITMLKDSDRNVRQAAVAALGELGSHDDLPQVISMLKDSDRNVRQAAIGIIKKLLKEKFEKI